MITSELESLKSLVTKLTKGKKFPTIHIKTISPPKLAFELLEISNTINYKNLLIQERKKVATLLYITLFHSNKMESYIFPYIRSNRFIENILSDFHNISIYPVLLDKSILISSHSNNFHTKRLLDTFLNCIPGGYPIWKNTQLKLLYTNSTLFYEELVIDSYQSKMDIEKLLYSKTVIKDKKYLEPHISILRENFWKYSQFRISNLKSEADILFILRSVLIPYKEESTERLKWLFKCVKDDTYKSLRKPLLEFLKELLGEPPNWTIFPNINEEAIYSYNALLHRIKFKYFEMIAQIVYEHYPLEKNEMSHLNNRTVFWRNYENQIQDIKIYLPESMLQTLILNRSNYQNQEYSISNNFLKQIGICEIESPIVLIFIESLLIIEFFQGSRNDTVILDNPDYIKLANFNNDTLNYLKMQYSCFVKHRHGWMTYLYRLLKDKYNIIPYDKNYFLLPIGTGKKRYFSEHNPRPYTSLKDSITDEECAKKEEVIFCASKIQKKI